MVNQFQKWHIPYDSSENGDQLITCYVFLRKEMVDEEVTLKNPSEAVEEVETLAEEFYNKPLILEKGTKFTSKHFIVS